MVLRLSAIFKKSKPGSESAKGSAESTRQTVNAASETPAKVPTQTTIDQNARYPIKKTPESKKVETPKKETAPKRTETSKKAAEKKKALSKEKKPSQTAKKTPAPKKEAQSGTEGVMPPELKGFEKVLKDFAAHSRLKYDASSANQIFAEYMAKTFRDMGYKMVLIRDQEKGLISMLDRASGSDEAIKNKIIVRCAYMKKGSVEAAVIMDAQDDGSFYRADETWCITPVDFTEAAKRRARKEGAKVRLFDGKKLFKEFLSRYL